MLLLSQPPHEVLTRDTDIDGGPPRPARVLSVMPTVTWSTGRFPPGLNPGPGAHALLREGQTGSGRPALPILRVWRPVRGKAGEPWRRERQCTLPPRGRHRAMGSRLWWPFKWPCWIILTHKNRSIDLGLQSPAHLGVGWRQGTGGAAQHVRVRVPESSEVAAGSPEDCPQLPAALAQECSLQGWVSQ